MPVSAEGFEPRGKRGYWYRITDAESRTPYIWGSCNGCGVRCLMAKHKKGFCSNSCAKTGSNNVRWSENILYGSQHDRVRSARGRASEHGCVFGHEATQYAWAFNEIGDRMDPESYIPMCFRCNNRYGAAVKMMMKDLGIRPWKPRIR